ncbi:MAG: M23 family metallopeptidase [Spirochaetaceae bacterium]|jgi:murein DD-endopeptidase MepM/ murein hydrolase activator NlpD|nr:M23 family metallopeptidase [Spirochaetaceae bacterium]
MNHRYRALGLLLVLFCLSVSAEDTVHIVQRGETVYSIARRYGVSLDEMLAFNGIADPRTLQVGLRLRIPRSAAPDNSASATGAQDASGYIEHRVARGETLYGLARRYDLSLEALRSANNLSGNSVLREGTVLRVPSRRVVEAGGPASASDDTRTAGAGTSAPVDSARQTEQRSVDQSIRWPVSAREVSYMTSKLYGVILMGEHAEAVKSLTQGTVVSTGPYRGYGKVAIVQRTGGYLYVYGGCESLTVREGDRVNPGTELGKLGIDAVSLKPQLFFLVYQNNSPIDPARAPRT